MIHDSFDKKKAINLSLENGILDIDKLLACNDFETIKEGLKTYPLTITEFFKNKYKDGDLRTIFEWSVDNKVTRVSDFLISGRMPSLSYGDKKPTFDDLIDYEIAELKGKGKNFINDKYFYTAKQYDYSYSNSLLKPDKTKEQVVDEIIKEISLKLDKETLTNGLTREYFEKLYNDKNFELLVIKLCVRLEAILKCDFHYEGTFEEMLSKYSKVHGYDRVDDDDWVNTVEREENKIFHKLRKYRNDIVHAEKNKESLSEDELKLAIEYVLKLG